MNKRLIVLMFGMVLLVVGSLGVSGLWTEDNAYVTELTALNSVLYASSISNVFVVDDIPKIIVGDEYGVNKSYEWNGSGWEENLSLINGIPSVGGWEAFFIFDNGNKLFRTGDEIFESYQWNGTTWNENSSLRNGMNLNPSYNSFGEFDWEGGQIIASNISGTGLTNFIGYQWNGTEWIENNTIVDGLVQDVESFGEMFVFYEFDTKKHVLMSGSSGDIDYSWGEEYLEQHGWIGTWNGTGWESDHSMLGNISASSMYSISLLQANSKLIMIFGSEYFSSITSYVMDAFSRPTVAQISPDNDTFTMDNNITLSYSFSDVNINKTVNCSLYADSNIDPLAIVNNTGFINGTTITYDFIDGTSDEYYWKVNCTNSYNLSAVTGVRKFTFDLEPITNASANNTSPYTDESISSSVTIGSYFGNLISAIFDWFVNNIWVFSETIEVTGNGTYNSTLDSGNYSAGDNVSVVTSIIEYDTDNITIIYNETIQPNISDFVGWWKFDGDALDSSGNDNNGAITGAVLTADRKENNNSSYLFNGTTDYITVADNDSLDISGDITISVWVKLDSAWNSMGGVLIKAPGTNWENANYLVGVEDDREVRFVWGDGSNWKYGKTSAINTNTWYHIVTQWDKIYINGVDQEVVFGGTSTNTHITNLNGIIIGSDSGNAIPFKGKIDDVRIYNRTLTSQEINTLYLTDTVGLQAIVDNTPPTYSNVIPTNESTGNYLTTYLNITVYDADDDLMDVYFYNNDDDSIIWYSEDVSDGSSAQQGWAGLVFNGTYYWYANITDGVNTVQTGVYEFTTGEQSYPPVLNLPFNNSILNTNYAVLNTTVTDPEGADMLVYWLGDGNLINTNTSISNGTNLINNWTGLSTGLHNWSVITENSFGNSTEVFGYFEIDLVSPVVTLDSPNDGAFIQDTSSVTLEYTITDTNLMNCTIYFDNETNPVDIINTTINQVTGSNSYTHTVGSNHTYYWKVYCLDEATNEYTTSIQEMIFNYLPNATIPVINNTIPYTNQSIMANTTVTDADGDFLTVTFNWFVNGVLSFIDLFIDIIPDTVVNSTLGSGNYSAGDKIYVEVNVSDAYNVTTINPGINATVNNSVPSYGNNVPTKGQAINEIPVKLNITVYDNDLETLSASFYDNLTNSLIGSAQTGLSNGSTAQVQWSAPTYDSVNYWYVNITDGNYVVSSARFYFNTTQPLVSSNLSLYTEKRNSGFIVDINYTNMTESTLTCGVYDNSTNVSCTSGDGNSGFYNSTCSVEGSGFAENITFTPYCSGVAETNGTPQSIYFVSSDFVIDMHSPTFENYTVLANETNTTDLVLNFTVSDLLSALVVDSCWYTLDTNVSDEILIPVCTSFGTYNLTLENLSEGAREVVIYVNDSFGDIWNGSQVFMINQVNFTDNVFESTVNNFSIRVYGLGVSPSSPIINYNNVNYTMDITSEGGNVYLLDKSIVAPIDLNTTDFYFIWDGERTQSYSQTIKIVDIGLCSNSTDTNKPIVTFYTRDVNYPRNLLNTTLVFTFTYGVGKSGGKTYSFEDLVEDNSSYNFCTINESLELFGNMVTIANKHGYNTLTNYYPSINFTTTTPREYTFYLSDNATTVPTVIKLVSTAGVPQEGLTVALQTYYPDLDAFVETGSGITSVLGDEIFYMKWYDTTYRFIFSNGRGVVLATGSLKISATPTTFQLPYIITNIYDNFDGIEYDLTYNNVTQQFTVTWVDTLARITQGCLLITKSNILNTTIISEQCLASHSATLYYAVDENVTGTGTYVANFYTSFNPDLTIDSIYATIGEIRSELAIAFQDGLGEVGTVWVSVIIVGTVTFTALISPILAVIATVIGVTIAWASGMLALEIGAIITLCIVGMLIIWGIRK